MRIRQRTLLAVVFAGGLVAASGCDRISEMVAASDPAPAPAAPVAAPGVAADAGPRFFGHKDFTLVMQETGRVTGTITFHYRDWGRRSAELTRMTNDGTGKVIDERSFTDGKVAVTVDNVTGEVEVYENPYASDVVVPPEPLAEGAYGEASMTRLGGQKTGETATIAGQPCEYWMALTAKMCVTPWGATLHSTATIGGTVTERKAVEVRIGDGGPDGAFVYEPPAGAAGAAQP